MKDKPASRSIETTIEIEAPAEAVWEALTEAEELIRWFPLQAAVERGVGGSVELAWGPELKGRCRIEVWDPPRHLRWVDLPEESQDPEKEGLPAPTVTDFFIEGRGGKTVLRLVHSGFSADAEWDEVFAGTCRGWEEELRNLRLYLERHRGTRRQTAWARAAIAVPFDEAWRRLLGPGGLFEARLEDVKEGESVELRARRGELVRGRLQTHFPGHSLTLILDDWNGAWLRLMLESCWGRPEAMLVLHAYGVPEKEVAAFQRHWDEQLRGLFPEA